MGTGDAKRELAREFRGPLPSGIESAETFCGGCLVLQGPAYDMEQDSADRISKSGVFDDWQVVVIHDDAGVARDTDKFLWATWTRFDPARDIYAKEIELKNNSIGYTAPIVIDARMKPWYPKEVEPAPETVKLVDERWSEYFR